MHILESNCVISTDEASFYKRVRGYEHILVNHSVGEFVFRFNEGNVRHHTMDRN